MVASGEGAGTWGQSFEGHFLLFALPFLSSFVSCACVRRILENGKIAYTSNKRWGDLQGDTKYHLSPRGGLMAIPTRMYFGN